ncbi:MAG: hypothetical protein ACRCSY_07875 [Cetobacterium sp.]
MKRENLVNYLVDINYKIQKANEQLESIVKISEEYKNILLELNINKTEDFSEKELNLALNADCEMGKMSEMIEKMFE